MWIKFWETYQEDLFKLLEVTSKEEDEWEKITQVEER